MSDGARSRGPQPAEEPEDLRLEQARTRIGTVLRDKWRLDAVLGAGGMATVFAATHRNGRRVAVKILHPELAMTEARKRFVNEAYAANRIEHPGVVAVLDDDVDDAGSPFLVMELLDGASVETVRERAGGKLPPAEVLTIAEQLLDVLAVAHDRGVIHRDLKPENLFLTRDGRLKLLDLGLARLRELTGSSRVTRSNAGIMGTPAYLPPEQARGQWDAIDARTDVWALGATLFTLLTGRLVHDAGTVHEALVAAITKPAPALRTIDPASPPAVAAVVDRALALDPGDRFPDARAMQSAVRAARAAIGGAPGLPVCLAAAQGTLKREGSSATLVSAQSSPLSLDVEPATLRRAETGASPGGARSRSRLALLVAGGCGALALGLLALRFGVAGAPPPQPASAAPPAATTAPAAPHSATGPAAPPSPAVTPSATVTDAGAMAPGEASGASIPAHAPHGPHRPGAAPAPTASPAPTAAATAPASPAPAPAVDPLDRRQ